MKNIVLLLACAAGCPCVASALTIIVFPSVAPNAYGSPSYADYVSNATTALENGLASYGTPGTPSYYQQTPVLETSDMIVTGFPSWEGQADPGTVFGPAYANELGNRPLFGVVITGDGQKISIDQLSFTAFSNDPGNLLGFSFAQGSYTYSSNYVGIINGPGGPTYVTSGPSSQLVDEIVGRGSGNADAAYCTGCTIAGQQAAINALLPDFVGMTRFTGTYTYGDGLAAGSGTFDIAPEPRTGFLVLPTLALAALWVIQRRQPAS
ncbi:MAG TPA: hypothetical protein VMH81_07410 [Bryobacteraceae bacterium]|nr:hypothetical protein [Bryobacteraceae bacterium]